jgi:hypothetical protein
MGKSIFIGTNDTFEVVVNYKEDGRRVKILAEPEKSKDDKGVEVVKSESVKLVFRYPNFADSQQILRAATTLDQNGTPSLNFLQLQTSLLYGLAQSWDVKDDKGQPVELNAANLSKLRVEIAKAIIEKVYTELGEGGLI